MEPEKTICRGLAKEKRSPGTSEEYKKRAVEKMREDRDNFKTMADAARKNKWEQFTQEVASRKALHKFWSLHRKMNGQRQISGTTSIKNEKGKEFDCDKSKGQAFLERFILQTHQDNLTK